MLLLVERSVVGQNFPRNTVYDDAPESWKKLKWSRFQTLVGTEDLKDFFTAQNLVTCPPGITQCYRYGKD